MDAELDQPTGSIHAPGGVGDGRRYATGEAARKGRGRAREARFQAIFEGAAVGVAVLNLEGCIMLGNPALHRMLGYGADELRGAIFTDLAHPDDEAEDRRMLGELIQEVRTSCQRETRHIRKDGQVTWARVSASLIRNDRGDADLVLVMIEDVTEQRRAENELRESHVRFQAVFYGAPVGISLIDREGRYVSVNPIRQEMLGYSEAELIGKRYQDLTYAEDVDYDERVNAEAREQRLDNFQLEKRFVRKDGAVRWARITAAVIRDEAGEIQYSISIAEDITEQRNLERQKDEFLSAAAHDLRTPLTTVKGRVQLLHRLLTAGDDLDRERILDNMARIDANVMRMVTLINELLDVANIQLGRDINLVMRPMDLVQLAETIVSEHGQVTDRHRIVMEARVPELIGSWDTTRLERVLGNLVSNAIKYSPSGGDICVALTREHAGGRDWAVLAVKDQGVGIPESDLPYIFERFHRGGNVAGKIPGTGIGLAAVRQIVEQHGGSITVESQEGRRTVFTVRLPL